MFPKIEEVLKKCGDFLFVWAGVLPAVVVCDPVLANEVLTSKACYEKGVLSICVRKVISDGIFSLPHYRWNKHRRILDAGFKHKAQLNFVPIINAHAKIMNAKLLEFLGKDECDLRNLIWSTILRLTSETLMGKVDVKDDDLPVEAYET